MVTKSNNAFGTLGTWTDYERGWGDPTWKDKNWGGWEASDADFFGDARKWFEDHDHYSQFVGDYGSKSLFDSFGGEYSFYNPGKTVGSNNKWSGGKANLFTLAKDLYYYELKNPLAPPPPPEPPPAPEPPPPPPETTYEPEPLVPTEPVEQWTAPEDPYVPESLIDLTEGDYTEGVTGGLPEDWIQQIENLFGQGQSDMQEAWSEIYDKGLESVGDIYTTQFDAWEDKYNAGQKAITDELTGFQGDFAALTGNLDDLGDMFEGLDDSVKQQYSDLGGKIGNLEGQIGHVDTKLDDVTQWNEQIGDVIKDYQEGQIDLQEQARAKASYGSMQGQPLNPQVRGVKTINLLDDYKKMVGDFGGARGSFNRKGMKIQNVNV